MPPEGMVVNDPKGELYHYTHSFLESMGYMVQVVDFNNPKKSCRYNPLQMIIDAVNENRIDDAQTYTWDFVTFLVEKNDHSEPIWSNGEMSVIAAAVMCVVYDNRDRPEYQNLTNVYNFIANMCKPVNKVLPIDAYMDKLPDSHPAKKLMAIAKLAPDKMGGSFYTAALTTLRLFITNDIYNMTKESEFSLSDVGAKLKQALFFILPDQKTTYYPIVTLLVSQQYEQLVTYAKKCGNRLPHRVNYILDEFGNFAAISDFQTKMTVAGGYGVRWNLFIQDFNQLIDVYGQEVAKIIQGNCHYWIYLHSQDNSTNEEISKSMGKYTTSTYSLGGSTQKYAAPSSSTNIQLSERSLLNPDEVAKIQRPYQLVISTNAPAIMYSPDISQWAFNAMLGMGDKAHNTRLIELDENARPERGGKSTEQLLWKPWEEILRESSAPPAAAVQGAPSQCLTINHHTLEGRRNSDEEAQKNRRGDNCGSNVRGDFRRGKRRGRTCRFKGGDRHKSSAERHFQHTASSCSAGRHSLHRVLCGAPRRRRGNGSEKVETAHDSCGCIGRSRGSRFGAHQRACRLLPVKENRMKYTSGQPPGRKLFLQRHK